jgi:hypothetical protein
MLTWKPAPSFPMNSFSVNNFRLLLCNLLAQESTNVIEMISSKKSGGSGSGGRGTSTMMSEDGTGGLDDGGHSGPSGHSGGGNKYKKEKLEINRKYFSDIYADMTLMTWLDVIDQGEHGPEGALKIALIQLISFIDPLNENNDQSHSKAIKQGVESRRIITDRITLRDGTLPNIVSLVAQKDDQLASMACILIRHMLISKPILREILSFMNLPSVLFSTLVPAENIQHLIMYVEEMTVQAKEKEEKEKEEAKIVQFVSESSGGSETEYDPNEDQQQQHYKRNMMMILPRSKSSHLRQQQQKEKEKEKQKHRRRAHGRHHSRHHNKMERKKKGKKKRVNRQPFRDL